MSRSIRVLVALAVGMSGLGLSGPVIAADNSTLPVCSSCAASEVFANKDIGGVKFPKHILHNGSGNEVGLAASPLYFGFGTGVQLPAYAAIPTFKIDQTTPGTTNAVQVTNTLTAVTPGDDVTTYTTASPVIGNVLLWDGTNNDRWKSFGTGIAGVSVQAATTGGCTPGKALSAASTNGTNVKNAAGTLCKMLAINTTATLYYLKTYNTSSTPTCNSDTVVGTYPIPPSNGGVAIPLGPFGEAYSTGISFCLTGGSADNDNTNAATGVTIAYSYK